MRCLGDLPIAAIIPAQLEQVVGALATEGKHTGEEVRPEPVERAWHVARQVFHYTICHDTITANPMTRSHFCAQPRDPEIASLDHTR